MAEMATIKTEPVVPLDRRQRQTDRELQKKAGRREIRYRLIVDTAKCEVAEP